MHKVLSESDMVREVKRAKIVNYIVLALLLSITFAIIVGFTVASTPFSRHGGSMSQVNAPT